MGWVHFNDRIALLLLILIPALWILDGFDKVHLGAEVTGALIATWTLVIQYYFRRQPPNEGTPPS